MTATEERSDRPAERPRVAAAAAPLEGEHQLAQRA